MLTTVAVETGQDVFALLDRPLWQLLYTFHHLADRAELRALEERKARVDAGLMTSLAFNAPAGLGEEMESACQAIELHEHGPADAADDAADLADLRTRAEALAARIERGRVLSPGALETPP